MLIEINQNTIDNTIAVTAHAADFKAEQPHTFFFKQDPTLANFDLGDQPGQKLPAIPESLSWSVLKEPFFTPVFQCYRPCYARGLPAPSSTPLYNRFITGSPE